ncbi:MAG: hypothetical protein HY231_18350 [Acidobacteria bacterium]|nr:hypothetical protein [Acidobacteriota bacterium]
MHINKAFLMALLVISSVGLCGLCPPISNASVERGNATLHQEASAAPRITKAVLEKKRLTIEGENFADGAKLLVNGERVKSFKDELAPTTKLIVNKANKRLPIDEAVRLQVQNADGQISEPLGLFTGTTFTSQNTRDGFPVFIQVSRKFLIHFSAPLISWTLNFPPSRYRPVVEFVSYVNDIIPGSQGVFIAPQAGKAPFEMRGEIIGERPFLYVVGLSVVE